MQGRQVVFANAKTCPHGRYVQQVEHFADREAAVRQLQQVFEGDQQRLATALALVGEGERNVARVIALQLAEHRADMRRVGVDGR
ncbi:hypothetical protein D3C81_1562310 [compost metagenome]